MLEKQGVVVKVDGRYVWVATQNGCVSSECCMRGSCDWSLSEKYISICSKNTIQAISDLCLVEGDNVIVAILERGILRVSVLVYSLLLGFLILAVIVSTYFKLSDFFALAVCIAGLLFGLIILSKISRKSSSECNVVVVGKIAAPIGSSVVKIPVSMGS